MAISALLENGIEADETQYGYEYANAGTHALFGLGTVPRQFAKQKWESKQAQAIAYAKTQAEDLFGLCKTAACVYRLSFDYKRFFKILTQLSGELEIGEKTISSPIKLRYSIVKKFLKMATKMAADKRPTAVFTPATPAPANP